MKKVQEITKEPVCDFLPHTGSCFKKKIILGLSDFGTSGISESVRYPLIHWHNQGHEIWHLALGYTGTSAGVDSRLYPWKERLIPIMPKSEQTKFGQNDIRAALEMSKAEVIFGGFDIWMQNYIMQPSTSPFLDEPTKEILSHQKRKFTHIMYFPIDGSVQGKYLPLGMDESICGADIPITYSKYSQELIKNNINIDIPFIPIPHDPNIFKPMDKKECRKRMNFPEDGFIVGMVGTNQYRKTWGEFFDGVVPFAKQHKDVFIAPWTTWTHQIMGGAEIRDFVYRSGIQDRIIDPTANIGRLSDEGMAMLYNCFDVLVLTTVGEGCGLPPLRARACGVPALVSDNTSNTEFTGHPLELLKLRGKYFDNFGSNLERYLTDTNDLREKLELLYNNPALRKEVGDAGLERMKEMEFKNVMPMWDEVLNSIPGHEDEVLK